MKRVIFIVVFLCGLFTSAGPAQAARTLGTVSRTAVPLSQCPSGSSQCERDTISCSGLTNAKALVAVMPAKSTYRGTVVIYNGGGGTSFFTSMNTTRPEYLSVTRLRNAGLEIIQVSMDWRTGPLGVKGQGCRPATLTRFIHDTWYVPHGYTPPAPGHCGFCVFGHSQGSSAAVLALTEYGQESIVDGLFPAGGPSHVLIDEGCLGTPPTGEFTKIIDLTYGSFPGACDAHDPSWAGRWQQDSVEVGGDYNYPTTRVEVLSGNNDPWLSRSKAFVAAMTSPVKHTIYAGGHKISSSAGLAAMEAAFLW